jgi:prepilin-type N-terminal cleavage/methylation domain-containing protein
MRKGFTLIELLVVVGIIAILAIAALIAINPLEAQRRSRDSARLQDLARLSSVIEAYINDNGSTGLPAATNTGATVARSQACSTTNWLGNLNFCQYIKQIPLDPQNGRVINALTGGGTAASPTRADVNAGYGFVWSAAAGNYELCSRLEASKNFEVLSADGGNAPALFETGTDLSLGCATP